MSLAALLFVDKSCSPSQQSSLLEATECVEQLVHSMTSQELSVYVLEEDCPHLYNVLENQIPYNKNKSIQVKNIALQTFDKIMLSEAKARQQTEQEHQLN